jgi:prolyl-tRNA synthetase
VSALLEIIQKDLFTCARDTYQERLKAITKWEDLVPALDSKNVVVIPWCEREQCEDDIKERSARA